MKTTTALICTTGAILFLDVSRAQVSTNDVSMALWTKARSLHKLDQIDAAKQAYARCIYMACGRALDPNSRFWSPAEDCAKFGRKLVV